MAKKLKNKSVVLACLALGILISLQIRIINIENNGMSTFERGEQLLRQLKSLKAEEKSLNKEINNTKMEIASYKGDNESNLKDEIEKYENLSGYTDIVGKGIEVKINPLDTVDKSDVTKEITYNYDLLLSMVNKLNSAQAEAISINGQRILSSTYMEIKEDKLYVNNIEIKEPIVVQAIGNPDTLKSALKIKYGIIWEIEHYYNSKVEIKELDKLKINKGSKNV